MALMDRNQGETEVLIHDSTLKLTGHDKSIKTRRQQINVIGCFNKLANAYFGITEWQDFIFIR